MGATMRNWTFHPKLYLFQQGHQTTAMIGSANLTSGGIVDNHELSAVVAGNHAGWEGQIDDWINQLAEGEEIVAANPTLIAEYTRLRNIYKVHEAVAKKAVHDKLSKPTSRFDALAAILARMKADNTDKGFNNQKQIRSEAFAQAVTQLNNIAAANPLDQKIFLKLYEPLVQGLWHSGGLGHALIN